MNELALFAGAGGGILGGYLLGWRTICAVEIDPYAASVLVARQNDGILPPFPVWDDVRTFDGKPWRGLVDVVSGGFPCQDISTAGKGAGIDGERSGLWREMARIIGEVQPRFVFVENSPALIQRGLARILGDLAKMGFDAEWGIVGADDVGAWHIRKRTWIFAHAHDQGKPQSEGIDEKKRERIGDSLEKAPDSLCSRLSGMRAIKEGANRGKPGGCFAAGDWWAAEPGVVRMAHGAPNRVDRIKALGNAQVPAVAKRAWEILTAL